MIPSYKLFTENEFTKVGDKYYISTTSGYVDDRTRVLNDGDTFGVFNRWGDVQRIGTGAFGLFHQGTRFLNLFELTMNGCRPMLLSSAIEESNERLTVHLTNPDLSKDGQLQLEKGRIHIHRDSTIVDAELIDYITVENFDLSPHQILLEIVFGSDFKDIFEIRGMHRERRGEILPPSVSPDGLGRLAYRGLDNVMRETLVQFSSRPDHIEPLKASYRISLPPKKTWKLEVRFACRIADNASQESLKTGPSTCKAELARGIEVSRLTTSNELFDRWLDRSRVDLFSILAPTAHGMYPYAGIPWYNTPFGRDGLITALMMLWVAPGLAKHVLRYAAATQAIDHDPYHDAEPGKIFHEIRDGEMAALGETPFRRYYGTVDATPLFIVLAGNYYRATDDLETIMQIWPNLLAALEWIDKYGDQDGDGYVEYAHKAESGLFNQGWKDSHDSVSHADGAMAVPPIALCEVQGYVYDAKRQGAGLARALGEEEIAQRLESEARSLKEAFNRDFWDEELGTFVLALDRDKKPCRVKTSNAGHCLYSEIVDPKHAHRLVLSLMDPDMNSGWGIRTLGRSAAQFNPMSYHNGSIWPHDNSIIALGLSRYGYRAECVQLLTAMFDVSNSMEDHRIPELFCGFTRSHGEAPTQYPVACSPQAWAVASVYALLQAVLALKVDAPRRTIEMQRPILPEYLCHLRIRGLVAGRETIDMDIKRFERDIGINVLKKSDAWSVVITK